jgi:hypothetical protein
VEFNGLEEDIVGTRYEEEDQFMPRLVFGDGYVVMVFDRWEAVAVAGIVVAAVVGEIQY